MSLQNAILKITAFHTKKIAYVYVRQSSGAGVRRNVAGGERQYEVAEMARQLGWPAENIRIVDEDQARSGTTTDGRYGYMQMLDDIAEGLVGAVFSTEAARVGRDSADWHIMIKLCDYTATLVIDVDGAYDASDLNDNMIMKVKALMAEVEVRWINSRLMGSKMLLAKKGELRTFTPVGYVYDEDNKLIIDPDEDVERAVRLLFDLFRRHGSATRVVAHFNENGLTFPTPYRDGLRRGQYDWRPLTTTRVNFILHAPTYTGTYVFGRSKVIKTMVRKEGEAPRMVKRQVKLPREDWQIVLHDAHPAYITWDEFVENEERLSKNRNTPSRGVPRAGSALLHGILLCGKCGQAMRVSYPHIPSTPYYSCIFKRVQYAGKTCQTMPGDLIDRAVEQAFLEVLEPAQVEMSLEALGLAEEQALETDRQWAMRLKRAREALAEAEGRVLAVDYRNERAYKLVQENVEKKADELALLEREKAEQKKLVIEDLTPEERGTILASARDFQSLWRAETTDMVARKNLLRCLVEEVTLTRDGKVVNVGILWKTQERTELTVTFPPVGLKLRLPEPVLEFIKKLAPNHTNRQIASALNEAGMLNGRGQPFTRNRVMRIRERYEIRKHPLDNFSEVDYDGRYSSAAVAGMLDVHTTAVLMWCREGRLDAVKDKLEQRWWIKATPEELAEFKKTIRRWPSRVRKGVNVPELPDLAALGLNGVAPEGLQDA
jgi:DNA invertase Pin-like site-specific DNA recombinase